MKRLRLNLTKRTNAEIKNADHGHVVGIVKLIKAGNGASSGFDFNLP
jgi:hypothetical protein